MIKKITKCWNCGCDVPVINYKVFTGIPICSNCKCQYPEKPKLEVLLSKYQDEYLNLRNTDSEEADKKLNQFFNLLHELTFNIICSKLKGSAKMLDKEEIEDMVQWSLIKMMTYYKTKPNFKIKGSFTGYLSQVVLYPLYNKKKKLKNQNEVSLDAPISNSIDNTQTLLDKLSLTEDNFSIDAKLDSYQTSLLCDEIYSFIKTTINKVFDTLEKEKRNDSFSLVLQLIMCYSHLLNKKNDRFFSELWKTSSLELQDIYRGSLTILYKTITGGYN